MPASILLDEIRRAVSCLPTQSYWTRDEDALHYFNDMSQVLSSFSSCCFAHFRHIHTLPLFLARWCCTSFNLIGWNDKSRCLSTDFNSIEREKMIRYFISMIRYTCYRIFSSVVSPASNTYMRYQYVFFYFGQGGRAGLIYVISN